MHMRIATLPFIIKSSYLPVVVHRLIFPSCCPPSLSMVHQVRILREMRPGTIETPQQQRFVGEYSKLLWKEFAALERQMQSLSGILELRQMPQSPPQPVSQSRAHQGEGAGALTSIFVGPSNPATRPTTFSADETNWKLPDGYPRTPHLPFSPEVSSDDIQLDDGACSDLLDHEASDSVGWVGACLLTVIKPAYLVQMMSNKLISGCDHREA